VSVTVVEGPETVTIEVDDTGPGIPPDELPHIFERFYRGTNTGEERASGSGLGLAIVRSIVEMHDGEVDVSSAVGEGTAIRIVLPRTEVETDAAQAKVNETSPVAHAARNPGALG
jgi:signal transduction histidine kinase